MVGRDSVDDKDGGTVCGMPMQGDFCAIGGLHVGVLGLGAVIRGQAHGGLAAEQYEEQKGH